MHRYLSRLSTKAALTPALLLSILYYIDRLSALHPFFLLDSLNVHRFLLTAAAVASKGLSDSCLRTTDYAYVGGVEASELRRLERVLLHYLDWRVIPKPDILTAYYFGLIARSGRYAIGVIEGCVSQTGLQASDDGGWNSGSLVQTDCW